MPIRKSTPHVTQNEGLIFERSSPGRIGYDFPNLDVPEVDLANALGSENVREPIQDFPEVSEMDVVRHFTRLSTWNYSIDAGAPLHSLLEDAQCLLGESLSTFELLTDSQTSEAYWGAIYMLRQGVALLTAAQTVAPTWDAQ